MPGLRSGKAVASQAPRRLQPTDRWPVQMGRREPRRARQRRWTPRDSYADPRVMCRSSIKLGVLTAWPMWHLRVTSSPVSAGDAGRQPASVACPQSFGRKPLRSRGGQDPQKGKTGQSPSKAARKAFSPRRVLVGLTLTPVRGNELTPRSSTVRNGSLASSLLGSMNITVSRSVGGLL